MNEEEKKTIDLFIKKIDKCDETVTIRDLSVGEEYRMLQTVQKGLYLMEKLQQELQKEKEKNKKLEDEAILLRMTHDYDVRMIDEVKGESVELFKTIDMMAKDLLDDSIRPTFWIIKGIKDKQQVKEYYFKKARGEEDG